MAQADLVSLTAKLELEAAQFKKGMDQANKYLDKMDKRSKTLSRGMRTLGIAIAGAFSVDSIKRTLDWADALAKTSHELGVNMQNLQAYRRQAELSGVSQGTMEGSLRTFTKRLGEAQLGLGPLHTKLSKFNVPLLEALKNSDNVNHALFILADAMAGTETQIEKNTLAVAAFSKGGLSMVSMMDKGGYAMWELTEDMVVLGDESFKTAERINDDWTKMWGDLVTKSKGSMLEMLRNVRLGFTAVTELELDELIKIRDETLASYEKANKAFGGGSGRGIFKNTGMSDAQQAELHRLDREIKWKKKEMAKDEARQQKLKDDSTSTFKAGDEKDPATGGGGIPAPIDTSELDRVIALFDKMETDFDDRLASMRSIADAANPLDPLVREIIRVRGLMDEFPQYAEQGMNAIMDLQEQIDETMADGAEKVKEVTKTVTFMGTDIGENIKAWSTQAGDAFLDFTKGAKGAFKDLANSILNDLARIAIQQAITKPLGNMLTDLFGSANGNAFQNGKLVNAYASGGVVSSPTFFNSDQGLSVAGEAGAEGILPLSRGKGGRLGVDASGAGGNTTVNVINNSGSEATVTEESDGAGGQSITVLIEAAVSNYIQSGAGNSDFSSHFGARPRPR